MQPQGQTPFNRTDFIQGPHHSSIQIKKIRKLISTVLFPPAYIYKVIYIIEQYERIKGTEGEVFVTHL